MHEQGNEHEGEPPVEHEADSERSKMLERLRADPRARVHESPRSTLVMPLNAKQLAQLKRALGRDEGERPEQDEERTVELTFEADDETHTVELTEAEAGEFLLDQAAQAEAVPDEREPLAIDAFDADWIKGDKAVVRCERWVGPTPNGGTWAEAYIARDGTVRELVEYGPDDRPFKRTYDPDPDSPEGNRDWVLG